MKKLTVLILTLCMCSVAHAKLRKVKIDTPTLSKSARRNIIANREYGKPYKKLKSIQRAGVRTAADNAKIIFADVCGEGAAHYLTWHTYHLKWGRNGHLRWLKNRRRKPKVKKIVVVKHVVKKIYVDRTVTVVQTRVVFKKKKKPIHKEKTRVSANGFYLENGVGGRNLARGGGAGVNAILIRRFDKGLSDAIFRLEFGLEQFGSKFYCGGWFAGNTMEANILVGTGLGNKDLNGQVLLGFGTDIFYVRGYFDHEWFKVFDGVAKGILAGRLDSRLVSAALRLNFGFGNHYYLGDRSDLFRLDLSGRGEIHAGRRFDVSLTVGTVRDLYHKRGSWRKGMTKHYGKGCLLGRIAKGVYGEGCLEGGRINLGPTYSPYGRTKIDYVKPSLGIGIEL